MFNNFRSKLSKKINLCKNNNAGFSLVELIICSLILGTVTVTVCSMMSSGTNMYTRLDRQSVLLFRSQLAQNQIKELVIDCDGLCVLDDKLYVANFDSDGKLNVSAFSFDDDEDKIILTEFNDHQKIMDGEFDTIDADKISEQPLSSKITFFGYKPYFFQDKTDGTMHVESITFDFTYEIKNASYSKTMVVSLKNNPLYISVADEGESLPATLIKRLGGSI